jgi:hypothetical protein
MFATGSAGVVELRGKLRPLDRPAQAPGRGACP